MRTSRIVEINDYNIELGVEETKEPEVVETNELKVIPTNNYLITT